MSFIWYCQHSYTVKITYYWQMYLVHPLSSSMTVLWTIMVYFYTLRLGWVVISQIPHTTYLYIFICNDVMNWWRYIFRNSMQLYQKQKCPCMTKVSIIRHLYSKPQKQFRMKHRMNHIIRQNKHTIQSQNEIGWDSIYLFFFSFVVFI